MRVGRAAIEKAFRSDQTLMRQCGAWAKTALRAANEGTNAGGAALVPDDFQNAIITLREQYGVFRQRSNVVKMASDTKIAPRRTAGLTAYFTGEGTAPTESEPTWDGVSLTARKIGTLTKMSSELLEDAPEDLAAWLADECAYAFSVTEDGCGFNGDGTSTYGGMRGITTLAVDGNHNAGKVVAASGHGTFGTLDATDMGNLIAAAPKYALAGAAIYISQFGYGATLVRLAGTSGGLVANIGADGNLRANWMGFPVQLAQSLPQVSTSLTSKVMAVFGDLSLASALGDRREVTIKRSRHRYLELDQIGILGTERFDINVHDMGDNTNAGPLVCLVGG